MKKEKNAFSNLPPGFSEEDFTPINIKTIKETEKGLEIELKPTLEKEEGAEYHFKFENGIYHILRNNETIFTPGGIAVTVTHEALAQRTVEHMNIYGEDYNSTYSIVTFVYSNIEFFEKTPKEELDRAILNDHNTDWLFGIEDYADNEKFKEWFPDYGYNGNHDENFKNWLSKLTRFQTGAVIIIGASLSSVNTAWLLSNVWKQENLKQLAHEYFNIWDNYREMVDPDFNIFWRPNELKMIFENYILCQELKI